VRAFVNDPGEHIAEAQRQLRERLASAGQADEQRKRLAAELAGKEQERERVLGMIRRGRITPTRPSASWMPLQPRPPRSET
jgi:hypothetical protein